MIKEEITIETNELVLKLDELTERLIPLVVKNAIYQKDEKQLQTEIHPTNEFTAAHVFNHILTWAYRKDPHPIVKFNGEEVMTVTFRGDAALAILDLIE